MQMVDPECPVCGCEVFAPFAFGVINGSDYPEPQAHLTATCERCGGILVGRAVTELVTEDRLEMTMQVSEFVPNVNRDWAAAWAESVRRFAATAKL